MITGETILIAHFGYPTKTFKAPMIYNPYFDKIGLNAVVMQMGVKAEDYAEVLKAAFKLTNIRPPDLNEFAMTPIRRSSAVLCRERPSRCS
jgi:hypothetical protein